MDATENTPNRPVSPRRRPRSKMQIFKEAYLPVIIAGIALILIIVFIIGSITRAVQKKKYEEQSSINASIAQASEEKRLQQEADKLILEAEVLAKSYDYDGAIAILDTFEGNINDYANISDARANYVNAKEQLVAWDDPSQIINLSFQLLIADPSRAFNHATYSTSFSQNFITADEFFKILQQLYDNGYILVSMDDYLAAETNEAGETVYASKTLYLPRGKKPVVLTQTNVNYNIYLIDSDGDKLPDKNGGGFASKMILDKDGNITCEMIDQNGEVITGAFDLVPILDSFVEVHPDFSYKGAKAVLALTGYNGLFGYRTNKEAITDFSEDAYNRALKSAADVAQALKDNGYELACYTYENISYKQASVANIQADLARWNEEVVPILGALDTLVYAQLDDITTEDVYQGEKYDLLKDQGFKKFIGFCNEGTPWATTTDEYFRQGRIMVTGKNLKEHADWFNNLFDVTIVWDKARGEMN